jgi:energy-coupling factor transporter transmembrane protein EcfT
MMRVKRTAKAKRKWDWRDYLVVILCLAGALFFVRLFWLDLNRAFARLSQAP